MDKRKYLVIKYFNSPHAQKAGKLFVNVGRGSVLSSLGRAESNSSKVSPLGVRTIRNNRICLLLITLLRPKGPIYEAPDGQGTVVPGRLVQSLGKLHTVLRGEGGVGALPPEAPG